MCACVIVILGDAQCTVSQTCHATAMLDTKGIIVVVVVKVVIFHYLSARKTCLILHHLIQFKVAVHNIQPLDVTL